MQALGDPSEGSVGSLSRSSRTGKYSMDFSASKDIILLPVACRACRFCSLGQVVYPVNTFLFSSIAGFIVSVCASNQSSDLFFFLPKLDLAAPWTASLK